MAAVSMVLHELEFSRLPRFIEPKLERTHQYTKVEIMETLKGYERKRGKTTFRRVSISPALPPKYGPYEDVGI
jgi:hypothetical protein